ncbi:hypothetical protein HK101_007269 [Irineochytrium annulatum]|nr:hypothetical protein HK101_007269 [Irineochytrium annulatum]
MIEKEFQMLLRPGEGAGQDHGRPEALGGRVEELTRDEQAGEQGVAVTFVAWVQLADYIDQNVVDYSHGGKRKEGREICSLSVESRRSRGGDLADHT